MDDRCQICARELTGADVDRLVCRRCEDVIRGRLQALPALYAQLGQHLLPRPAATEHTTGGPVEAPAPIRLDVLSQLHTGGTADVLAEWAADWQQHVDDPAGRAGGIDGTVAYLLRHLWWACAGYDQVADFGAAVRILHREAARVVGDPAARTVLGRHPGCGGRIEARPQDPVIRCTTCPRTWNGPLAWLHLRTVLDGGADAA